MKKCKCCGKIKEYSDFHKMNTSKDGYRTYCKECRKTMTIEYRNKNKNKLNEKQKEYYQNNKENKKSYDKIYRENHKEKYKLLSEKWCKIYKEDRINNPEKYKQKDKEWRNNNKDLIKEINNRYFKKHKYRFAWRKILHYSLRTLGKKKEGKTIDLLGYSALELKEHLEKLFQDGMSWDNHGEWHIDHIKPISLFDENTPIKIVNSLNNLQPLWAKDNLSKSDKY